MGLRCVLVRWWLPKAQKTYVFWKQCSSGKAEARNNKKPVTTVRKPRSKNKNYAAPETHAARRETGRAPAPPHPNVGPRRAGLRPRYRCCVHAASYFWAPDSELRLPRRIAPSPAPSQRPRQTAVSHGALGPRQSTSRAPRPALRFVADCMLAQAAPGRRARCGARCGAHERPAWPRVRRCMGGAALPRRRSGVAWSPECQHAAIHAASRPSESGGDAAVAVSPRTPGGRRER